MKHRTLTMVLLGSFACLAGGAGISSASTETLSLPDDYILDEAFALYVEENPGDWIGAQELVNSLGGSMTISGDNGEIVSAEEATAAFDALNGNDQPDGITPLAWPAQAFTAHVAVVTSGPTDSTVSIAGAWNWKDNFIGQGSPVDIAALRVNKSCGNWGSYSASTYKWNGVKTTGRTSLRSGGVGTAGPVWNIVDGVTNFENQVDNGTVSAVYTRTPCSATDKKNIQAEFIYEGNAGGSVLGVNIGWGVFSVSYNNPGFTQTRSSGAKTVPY